MTGVHLVLGVVGRVLVQVGEQDRLRVGRLDVFSGAAVAVAAGADFVVEGTVDLWGYVSFWVFGMLWGGFGEPCLALCRRWRRGSSPL